MTVMQKERDDMQLVYLYIDRYCNFHQEEFNFDPEVRLHFEEDSDVVTASDAQFQLPEGFWGENINCLSAVVGNNGAGKTSLMQFVIELFLEAHGYGAAKTGGILVFGEGDRLYEYCGGMWREHPVHVRLNSQKYRYVQALRQFGAGNALGRTKLIYLTNVLTMRDSRRGQWYKSLRTAPLYDSSAGNVFVSDAEKDVNHIAREGSATAMELETYFLYEQYKQIKFVFDKNQHETCAKLKDAGFPVPVPERLYIDLMLDSQLGITLFSDTGLLEELDSLDSFPDQEIDRNFFPDLYPRQGEEKLLKYDPYLFLQKQLGRCAIWCAVRSAANLMTSTEKRALHTFLLNWQEDTCDEIDIFQAIWAEMQKIKRQKQEEAWKFLTSCYSSYVTFLGLISSEPLEKHFRIETELSGIPSEDSEKEDIFFSVDTADAEWSINFIQKYRCVCNPDYFLDFHWNLSSGENSLLSLFASLYYIYGADFVNPKNGDYQIWNEFPQGERAKCGSIILLIDEADLTYHPEWQREFIDLLTAFLPRVYPPVCCQNLQVILTTHSPVLLSDIPQQSVIYLKYDPETHRTKVDNSPQEGTFGQNIHLLYKNSFFLKEGTIGRFAHRKIEHLIQQLQAVEKGEDRGKSSEELMDRLEHRLRPCAELIAEPIIRRRVLTWIDTLEKKLLPDGRDDRFRKMSDTELEQEMGRLRAELHRRKHD